MRDWAHSRRLGTPADEAGSVVLRQPPASKLANLFRIDVRDHALGLVTQQLGGRVTEHPPGGWLGPRTPSLREGPGSASVSSGSPDPVAGTGARVPLPRVPLNQGDPPCSSPAWPPGPRQGWAAGSDRFWLLTLRVARTFLDNLRLICSDHGYPARRAARVADPDGSPRSCSTFREGGLEGLREWNPNRPVSEMAADRDWIRESFDKQPVRTVAEACERTLSTRLLAKLHQVRTARIRVAGGGAGGDAPDPQATALGLPCGQPQPPKRPFPQRFAINHGGDQRGVSIRPI